MDIAQLRTLIHVAELGSLTKAAERLNIAQPALSRQVRLLEEELGAALFKRHGRGMVVTETGREILRHAGRVMSELDAIRAVAERGATNFQGVVAVGMPPTASELISLELVQRVAQAHPRLSLRLVSAFSGHLQDWLRKGELDLAMSYTPEPTRSLRIAPMMSEDLLLITAGRGPRAPTPFAALAGMRLVLPSPRHALRELLDDCARQAGIRLSPATEADSYKVMVDMAQSGLGATVLPLASVHPRIEAGLLSAAPLIDPAPIRKLVLAFPADRKVAPAARFVGDTIRNIAADMVGSGVWGGRMSETPPED